MEVRADTIYAEEQFCLVEFAIQSQIWSRTGAVDPQNFTYTSMEAEGSGLVWFRMEQGGWKVGSIFQDGTCSDVLGFSEMVAALDDYYEELRRTVKKQDCSGGRLPDGQLVEQQGKAGSPQDRFNLGLHASAHQKRTERVRPKNEAAAVPAEAATGSFKAQQFVKPLWKKLQKVCGGGDIALPPALRVQSKT
jgi:hypothetical protein